ncbi:hypothetical protein JO84_gp083 [Aureococcus anophagefferens virus]|uniref:HNH endonuclease n=1 Tax=Aureococcus anophagefferens virus TaxID=1474867 RepID=A0A076FG75_9VIRU|nr:hypothetical protein JO84_gp083 [Aureococcus anophagefferens virus]AII17055.1 hypothetical protein AaV_083 [Aureococcus anophagefferens virus]UOG94383.1 hypothetical protein MKD35_348 [Aureococcus anophagefferens virus]
MNFAPGTEGTFMQTEGKLENKEPFINRNNAIIEELARNPYNLYYAGDTELKPSFNPNDDFIPAVFHKLSDDKQSITPYNFKYPYKFDKSVTKLFNGKREIGKTGDQVNLMIEGRTKPKLFRIHHLQIVSSNPNFNWLSFYQGIADGTLSVDHLLGNHERCHPNLLEVVPRDENRNRTGYFKRTEAEIQGDIQRSESNSIPVSLFENGKPRCDENGITIEYKNAYECAEAIYKGDYDDHEIKKLSYKITNRLYGNTKSPTIEGYEEFTYKYDQSYLDIQEPITYDVYYFENKVWVLKEKGVLEVVITFEELEEWRQKMIKDKFKKDIPEGVAKSGRINIKTNQKIGLRNMTYGSWNKRVNIRLYGSSCIYTLSLYWFGTKEEIERYEQKKIDNENIMICHYDGEFPHPCVKRPSDVGEDGEENSNIWGTFRVDTQSNNNRDTAYAKIRKDEKKKKGHFKAFNVKDGKQIGDRIFYSPQHFNMWAQKNGYKEKFKHINNILNPDTNRKIEQGLTFKKHIYPPETPIEV